MNKILDNIMSLFWKKTKDNGGNDIKLDFYDLSPTTDIKDGEIYSQALKWAIENKNIKNIALTGPFGSGKSSIIN